MRTKLFAVALAVILSPALHANPEYSASLPTADERAELMDAANQPIWNRLGDFRENKIEIVKTGKEGSVVDHRYYDRLAKDSGLENWLKKRGLSLAAFKYLQVRNVDVAQAVFNEQQAKYEIPVFFDIRFVYGPIRQGTILTSGMIRLSPRAEPGTAAQVGALETKSTPLEINLFSFSQPLENWSYERGILAPFGGPFVSAVGLAALRLYFEDPEALNDLRVKSGISPALEMR